MFSFLQHLVLWLKDCLTLKNASRNGEASLNKRNCFDWDIFGDRILAYSGANVQKSLLSRRFGYPTKDWEIHSVYGRLLDYPGELAGMILSSFEN